VSFVKKSHAVPLTINRQAAKGRFKPKDIKIISVSISMRCPHCLGSQYRKSAFDVSEKNPAGAKCIFCKTAMVALNPAAMNTLAKLKINNDMLHR
jgi:hypothetical protein